MSIDWFTTLAQIVNFLILVALLKRFLYGPITKAMEQREEKIAARLQEAAVQLEEARAEAQRYRQKQQALEAQKAEWSARAQQEVEQERQAMLQQAREEVEAARVNWYDALEREKQNFLQALRQRTGQQLTIAARRALGDLANASLEAQIVETFIDRLRQLDASQLQMLHASPELTHEAIVRTTFPLTPEARDRLIATIRKQITDGVEVKFETVSEPICGIELRDRGYKISWNLAQYLDTLEADLERALAK